MSENYFAKNLKFLRTSRGMEQLELAQMLGRKSGSSVSEWESGGYTPKAGTLSDVARIFNVNLSDLMDKDLSKTDNLKLSITSRPIPLLGTIAAGLPILAL